MKPLTFAWIVGIVLAVVVIYAVIRRWWLSKVEHDEAEFVDAMMQGIHVREDGSIGDDPPEPPIGN